MIEDPSLDSLVLKLSNNLTSLRSSYSEFVSNHSMPAEKTTEMQLEISDKYKQIHSFITNLKQSLTPDQQIVHSTKESLIKIKLYLQSLPQNKQTDSILKQIAEAGKYFIHLEQSALAAIDSRLDELLEMIISKRKADLSYLRHLESQVSIQKSLSPKATISRKPVFNEFSSKSCRGCQKIYQDFEGVIKKMSDLMQKINTQAKSVHVKEPGPVSQNPFFTPPNDKKKIEELESQNLFLRIKLKESEEKEAKEAECRKSLNTLNEEHFKLKEKLKNSQEIIEEKDDKIKQLQKAIDDENSSFKKMFESFGKLKEQLEKKITERDHELNRLEEENISQIKNLKFKISKQVSVEKENKELRKELNSLKMNYDQAIKNLQDTESKYLQKSLEAERSSRVSNFLSIKDTEIKSLEEDNENKLKEIRMQQKEIQELKNIIESSKSSPENLDFGLMKFEDTELISRYEEQLAELENLNEDYLSQINDFQLTINTLNNQLSQLTAKTEEQEEYIKDLQLIKKMSSNPVASFDEQSSEQFIETSPETLNKSLLEANPSFSDYISQIKSFYTSKLNELSVKLSESNKKNNELEDLISCQEFLYNKLDKQKYSYTNSGSSSRLVKRQQSSPAISGIQVKSLETLKKIFELKSSDPNIVTQIGIMLEEEDPKNFLERINHLITDRDSSYLIAEKYADIINELKEELEEEDEYCLLARVFKLKEELNNNKSVN